MAGTKGGSNQHSTSIAHRRCANMNTSAKLLAASAKRQRQGETLYAIQAACTEPLQLGSIAAEGCACANHATRLSIENCTC